MAVSTPRPPVTTATPASRYVTEGAIRLFTSGYLPRLRYLETVGQYMRFSIPSETTPGTEYILDYGPADDTVQCSCPAGQHNVPCKHVKLFTLSRGLSTEGRA